MPLLVHFFLFCLFVSKSALIVHIVRLGCDVSDLSEDANEDLEGLDATATYVASLLSAEPPGSKFFTIT